MGGSPAYSQTKFNVLSYTVTHSTVTRLPSLVCATFMGVLFFSGLPLINYLPRFMLSGLLVFSAVRRARGLGAGLGCSWGWG